jgi:type IV pilus assembly protein PilE
MHRSHLAAVRSSAGFTLLELMIVVAVIGILATIAYPMYGDYVTRGQITDGITKLGNFRTQMEKFYMDNRTYQGGGPGGCGVLDPAVAADDYFRIQCRAFAGPPETYLVTGTGVKGGVAGFVYTINQANAKTSTGTGGKYTNGACWALRKDGTC